MNDTVVEGVAEYWMAAIESVWTRTDRAPLYALIDGAQEPAAFAHLARSASHVSWCPLFEHTREERAMRSGPLLYRLDAPARGRIDFDRSVQWAAASYGVSWIASHLPLDVLARRLRARLDARLVGGVDVLARFFDARVLGEWVNVLEPTVRAAFLAIGETWWYLDRDERLNAIVCTTADSDPFAGPTQLTERAETRLLEVSYPDAIEAYLTEIDAAALAPMNRVTRYQFLIECLAVLHGAGIEGTRDQAHYCLIALSEGATFGTRAPWADVMQRVAAGEGSVLDFATAIASNEDASA
jgi:Domain of unknown function (DUF4123)